MEVAAAIGSAPERVTSEENFFDEQHPRRTAPPAPLVVAFLIFGMGIFFLTVGLNRPSIANIRTVDLVHLLVTGACLGVGLMALVLYFVGRRTG